MPSLLSTPGHHLHFPGAADHRPPSSLFAPRCHRSPSPFPVLPIPIPTPIPIPVTSSTVPIPCPCSQCHQHPVPVPGATIPVPIRTIAAHPGCGQLPVEPRRGRTGKERDNNRGREWAEQPWEGWGGRWDHRKEVHGGTGRAPGYRRRKGESAAAGHRPEGWEIGVGGLRGRARGAEPHAPESPNAAPHRRRARSARSRRGPFWHRDRRGLDQ